MIEAGDNDMENEAGSAALNRTEPSLPALDDEAYEDEGALDGEGEEGALDGDEEYEDQVILGRNAYRNNTPNKRSR